MHTCVTQHQWINSLRPSDTYMHRKLSTIGSDNGLSPGRHQAIIWTNARILLIGLLGTNFSEMLIEIPTFSFKKMSLKMPAILSQPQFVDNILCHRTVDCLFEFFYLIEPWTWSSGALIWIPAWISNHIHYEVWEESIHKLQWCSYWTLGMDNNLIPHFTGHMITYSWWD